MIRRWLGLVFVFACTAKPARCEDQELLKAAVGGNASSVSSISRLYAKVEFITFGPDESKPPVQVFDSDYWRESGYTRLRQTSKVGNPGRIIEFEAGGGKQRALLSMPGRSASSSLRTLIIHQENHPFIVIDPWRHALMGLPLFQGESKPVMPLAEGITQLQVKRVRNESGGRGRVAHLTLADDKNTYELWLDSGVNWLIRKAIRSRNTGGSFEMEVLEFTEPSPGVFFPEKVRLKGFTKGKLDVVQRVNFTDVQINSLNNPPFPKQLPIVAGMIATDEITGTQYPVDAFGNPTTRGTEFRHAPNPPAAAAPPIDPNSRDRFTVLRQPGTWLILLSVALFTTALSRLYLRRRREREEQ